MGPAKTKLPSRAAEKAKRPFEKTREQVLPRPLPLPGPLDQSLTSIGCRNPESKPSGIGPFFRFQETVLYGLY